jgi:PleD family two-component response regulator
VAAFQSTGHPIGAEHARVTISIGCATHGAQVSFPNVSEFVKAADQALYTAKLRGRNQTVPFDRRLPSVLAARSARTRA